MCIKAYMHKTTATGVEYLITSPVSCRDLLSTPSHAPKTMGFAKKYLIQYVSSTFQTANVRFSKHVSARTFECHKETTCPVGEHFHV